jgi:hypothetical protein
MTWARRTQPLGKRKALPGAELPLRDAPADRHHHFVELDEIDPRIRSRMLDERVCRIFKIIVPPFQAKSAARRSGSRKA